MYAKIMVGVDGSASAHKALKSAITLAKLMQAELHIACAYRHHSPQEASLSMVRPFEPDAPDSALQDYASKVVQGAKQTAIEAGLLPIAHVLRGPVARKIVEYAKEQGIEAIVLGSRGLGDTQGFLLGSISHKVTSLAECTCITVK